MHINGTFSDEHGSSGEAASAALLLVRRVSGLSAILPPGGLAQEYLHVVLT